MGKAESVKELSHLDDQGQVRMVDVSRKPGTLRIARAEGVIQLRDETIKALTAGELPKGNVLTTAKLAGIQAAKSTAQLIPLCHPLTLDWVDLDFEMEVDRIRITSVVKARESTGLEMEALTAVSVAALTIYDMCKAIDSQMRIDDIHLIEKTGGTSDRTSPPTAEAGQNRGRDKASTHPHQVHRETPVFRPRTGIIVLSDAVSAGRRADSSGRILKDGFEAAGCSVAPVVVLPDEPEQLLAAAKKMLADGVELLITAGGTGLGPRDQTIPTLEPLFESRLPGVEQALHAYGRGMIKTAMLSRLATGTIDGSIVVCLPGSPAAARDALQVLIPTLFHAFDIMRGGSHDS